jgi:tRNA dimethylallyltransferase
VSVVERALRIAAERPDDLLTIVGPTASGKTEFAVALAERLGGEVVSADSVQVYREFDIGSGKPSADQLSRAPHHLIGVAGPLDPMDAASWAERAAAAVDAVRARGRVPIVCGGTFLWIKALVFGLAEAPSASPAVRERHRTIAEAAGRPALHAMLRDVDAESALRLHPNDLVRVSRALEVFELTGKPLSAWHREHAATAARRRARLLAIACDAATLTERIRARARGWLAHGWVDEVQRLLDAGYAGARAMGSVGYAQVRAMLAGELPSAELEDTIVRATRVFARRQRTWLHHADVAWLDDGSSSELAGGVAGRL